MVAIPKNWKSRTVTIHDDSWGDTETVTIKSYYGDHDRQRVLSASTEYYRQADGTMKIVATIDKLSGLKRELAVVGWTLLDEDNDPLPFTTETLNNLPSEVTDYIDEQINLYWNKLGEPVTQEEADRLTKEAKDKKATFLRHSIPTDERGEVNGRQDDSSGTGSAIRSLSKSKN